METDQDKDWFIEWFNSPYYSLLYGHRDESEARCLIAKLLGYLQLKPGSRILDLACGKGRHSLELYKSGMIVTGIDLSEEHIRAASQIARPGLKFLRQDMRNFETLEQYDAVFNLFTSFGYFDSDTENAAVLNRVKLHLNPGGFFVLDYLNTEKITRQLPVEEVKSIGQVIFRISKKVRNGSIVKEIIVEDGTKTCHFTEKIQVLNDEKLHHLMDLSGLHVVNTFGDYNLGPFSRDTSDRLMMITRNE